MYPESPKRVVTMTVTDVVKPKGPEALIRVGGPGDDGDDRRIVQWSIGFLSRKTKTIVTTVVCRGIPSSSP